MGSKRLSKKSALRRYSRAIAVCGSAGAAVTGGLASAAFASSTSQDTAASQLPAPVTSVPLPADPSAVIASQAAADIPDVTAKAVQAFGADYAGQWIDSTGPDTILHVMAKTSPTSATSEAPFRAGLSKISNANTTVSYVKYSQSELDAFKQTLADAVAKNFSTPSTAPSNTMTIFDDTVDNAVGIVLAKADSGILQQLQPLVPADSLRVKWVTGVSQPAANGWVSGLGFSTFPPYKAGLEIDNPAAGNRCTTGFTLAINGAYKGVVAGHCANPGDVLYSPNGTEIGAASTIWSFGLGGDYDVIPITANRAGSILAEVRGGSGFVDDVIGRESNAQQGIGLTVCAAGVTTNAVSCGFLIYGAGAIQYYDGRWVSNLACGTENINPGDSGGPIYVPYPGNAGRAAGVISDTGPTGNCYTTIDAVLQGISNHFSGTPAYVLDANGSLS